MKSFSPFSVFPFASFSLVSLIYQQTLEDCETLLICQTYSPIWTPHLSSTLPCFPVYHFRSTALGTKSYFHKKYVQFQLYQWQVYGIYRQASKRYSFCFLPSRYRVTIQSPDSLLSLNFSVNECTKRVCHKEERERETERHFLLKREKP